MANLNYPVTLTPANEGGFVVTFKDVPEAITEGDNEAEALANAATALETALEFYTDAAQSLPVASKGKGRTISPCPQAVMKLSIYQAMWDQRLRKTDLARRLNWHLPQVDRLLDLNHATKLAQVELALAALGKRLDVAVI